MCECEQRTRSGRQKLRGFAKRKPRLGYTHNTWTITKYFGRVKKVEWTKAGVFPFIFKCSLLLLLLFFCCLPRLLLSFIFFFNCWRTCWSQCLALSVIGQERSPWSACTVHPRYVRRGARNVPFLKRTNPRTCPSPVRVRHESWLWEISSKRLHGAP